MKILCISNCNVLGLKGTLSHFFPEAEIEDYLIQRFQDKSNKLKNRIQEFDLVVSPKKIGNEIKEWSSEPDFIEFNPILFHAFHPDQCYLFSETGCLPGVLGDYHSISAFLGYKKGLNAEETESFMKTILEFPGLANLGWERSISKLYEKQSDIFDNLMPLLKKIMANEPFMYTVNHPKISVIYIALQLKLLNKNLIHSVSETLPIYDNLSNSTIWSLEKAVSSNFKFLNYYEAYKESETNNFLNRKQMIERSLNIYKKWNYDTSKIKLRGNLILDKIEKIANEYEPI